MSAIIEREVSSIFLLSPADCAGRRAAMLLSPGSTLPLARRLRAGRVTLGEVFTFLSGLYFRGKLTYAAAFGAPEGGTLVITPTRGLLPPDTIVSARRLRQFATVEVSADNPPYRQPLERDAARLADALDEATRVVLLGSIATGKYVDVLARIFGSRLHFPSAFIGRGDMSRGGLLLRSARAATELDYAVLDPRAPRRGSRPPRLEPRNLGTPEPKNPGTAKITPWPPLTSP